MRSQTTIPLVKAAHPVHVDKRCIARAAARSEETLVVDDRARVRPADMVEDKLVRILKEAALPISQSCFKSLILRRSAS